MNAAIAALLLAAAAPATDAYLDQTRTRWEGVSRQIWELAETSLQETKSANAMADVLEKEGFKVTRNVGGMPTAFVATAGSGAPVVGILAEYDALPGLSQQAGEAKKDPQAADAPGHGSEEDLKRHGGDAKALVEQMAVLTVGAMYASSEENKFIEVTYANGEKEVLYFKDFASGALIEGIVSRAKKFAVKRAIAKEGRGLRSEDLIRAIREEFKEHEDLPNTTNPDDWAKVSGKKGEKIVHLRTISGGPGESRQIETVTTGHYL